MGREGAGHRSDPAARVAQIPANRVTATRTSNTNSIFFHFFFDPATGLLSRDRGASLLNALRCATDPSRCLVGCARVVDACRVRRRVSRRIARAAYDAAMLKRESYRRIVVPVVALVGAAVVAQKAIGAKTRV